MPRYDYKCRDCENVFELVCDVESVSSPKQCPICLGYESKRYLANQSNQYIMPMQPFFDISKGRMIETKSQIREIEKREGVVLGGNAELKQEAEKNRRNLDREHTEKVTDGLISKLNEVAKKYE